MKGKAKLGRYGFKSLCFHYDCILVMIQTSILNLSLLHFCLILSPLPMHSHYLLTTHDTVLHVLCIYPPLLFPHPRIGRNTEKRRENKSEIRISKRFRVLHLVIVCALCNCVLYIYFVDFAIQFEIPPLLGLALP